MTPQADGTVSISEDVPKDYEKKTHERLSNTCEMARAKLQVLREPLSYDKSSTGARSH